MIGLRVNKLRVPVRNGSSTDILQEVWWFEIASDCLVRKNISNYESGGQEFESLRARHSTPEHAMDRVNARCCAAVRRVRPPPGRSAGPAGPPVGRARHMR